MFIAVFLLRLLLLKCVNRLSRALTRASLKDRRAENGVCVSLVSCYQRSRYISVICSCRQCHCSVTELID